MKICKAPTLWLNIYIYAVKIQGNVCVPVIVPHTLKNCWRRLRLDCGWRREEGLGDSCLLIFFFFFFFRSAKCMFLGYLFA